MKTIKIKNSSEISENFTGIAEWPNGSKWWFKEGKRHREDGPAIEQTIGLNEWWLEDENYRQVDLKDYVVLDHYQGRYNLIWYKLLGEDKVEEYPDIPGLIEK